MPVPMPHQLYGANFLAARTSGLLADEPRVGKTGAAIVASDYAMARSVLVITKASARANWGREFREWSSAGRNVQVIYKSTTPVDPKADVVIVGWGMVISKPLWIQLMAREWDVLILDESHEAKSPTAKRTKAVFGDVTLMRQTPSLARNARQVWCLTGTPIPNAPNDLFPMLKALAPNRLTEAAGSGWPDVSTYERFMNRYCVVRKKQINAYTYIDVVVGGRNETELAARLDGFMLRRTQKDVGIRPPLYAVLPLHVDKIPKELNDIDAAKVLEAAEKDNTSDLELHLGTVRRLTGKLKAGAVVDAVKEMFDSGLDKIVLMAWHTEVIDALREGLDQYGVVGIDGRTPATIRDSQARQFQTDPNTRVFVGQILAAGEAIDLSASAELWFVEASIVPKDMKQASLRITNHSQKRNALVRVCALEGSIDEALMTIVTRKVATIRNIMEN